MQFKILLIPFALNTCNFACGTEITRSTGLLFDFDNFIQTPVVEI